MMKIAMWVHVQPYREAILARLATMSGFELNLLQSADEIPAALHDADAFISAGASVYTPAVRDAIAAAPARLRWFQSVSAGNDNLEALGIRDGILVTGSGGHSGPVVAEHAIALLLSIAHAIPDWERAKAARIWKMPRKGAYKSLYGGVATVLGTGHIGSEIARRLKGLGIKTIGVSRSGKSVDHIDEALTMDQLDEALSRSDALLIAAALTEQTRHCINADRLKSLKPGAFVVNIARGGLIDQEALSQALRSGHLGGAAIDVTDPEPLPEDHMLWDVPNLIIVPHIGGSGSIESPRRLAETVAANMEAFLTGSALRTPLPIGRP